MPAPVSCADYGSIRGKDNFEADRVAAEQVPAQIPGLRRAAVENRRFLRQVVRFLAAEAGIDQFLNIGVGLPTQGAVHEIALEVKPQARVLYVDYDPVAAYEQASERVWPRPRTQILGFFDGLDLLEPGLVPKHPWRPAVGKAANGTPNIQWGGVARKT